MKIKDGYSQIIILYHFFIQYYNIINNINVKLLDLYKIEFISILRKMYYVIETLLII